MKSDLYTIRKKISGLSYVFTKNGVELPVLDITHPLFISNIDEVSSKKVIYHDGTRHKGDNSF